MNIKDKVLGILRSGETQRINFSFTGSTGMILTIEPAHFTRVANAVAENKISIVEGGAAAGMAKYSSRAEGTSAANTFYIGRMNRTSRDFNGLIVHEAVHAIFDLYNSALPWIDNETVAYVAQGYYLRNSGFPRGRMNTTGMPYVGLMIVDAIIGGEDFQFWIDAMHGSLDADPTYHNYIRTEFRGDG